MVGPKKVKGEPWFCMVGPKKTKKKPKSHTSKLCNCAKKPKKPKGFQEIQKVGNADRFAWKPLGFLGFLAQLHSLDMWALVFFGFFWDLPCKTMVYPLLFWDLPCKIIVSGILFWDLPCKIHGFRLCAPSPSPTPTASGNRSSSSKAQSQS